MESTYDEDLDENMFFQLLKNEYSELFHKATLEGWIICVPRAGSMPKYSLTYNDFFSHILIPSDELPETHFRTLNDRDVKIFNRVISIETTDLSVPFSIHILFEETYYTEDMMKYKVLCVETPMCQPPEGIKSESGIVNINTLRDCVDLLWTESCKEVLEKMDDHIQSFLLSNDQLEFEPLQSQKDIVGALYTQCLQTALKDCRLRDKTALNRHLLDNVKISVESYVLHGIYKKVIKGITKCTAAEDASFNKIVRNLADIQLRDLDISSEFQDVIPKARRELVKVESYSTVVGKVGCLRKTLSAISNLDSSYSKGNVVAADELLPLLVFLVLKSGLPNWIAHLTYMKEFNFSSSDYHANQHSFLVTSLEAAIEHIRGGIIIGPSEPESQIDYDLEDNTEEDINNIKKHTGVTSLAKLFEMTKTGDTENLEKILNQKESQRLGSLGSLNLCHPLCSCDKCDRKVSIYLCNMAPTVHSCDDRGFTILHIAAIYGQAKVIDVLLRLKANPNKSDYKGSSALHYSAARGHQNIIILLLQSGAKIDQSDNEGNTPLHLASNNGHETCVKAILCYAEYMDLKFDINAPNNQGDTALHNASRWGYESIVRLLLDYGASPTVENKRKLTPIDNAHNMNISNILSDITNRKVYNFALVSGNNEVNVAAATKIPLDFAENEADNNNESKNGPLFGIKPNSTEEIKKVERVLRAITYGDTRLASFYLGLEPSSHEKNDKACHPLCPCKNKLITEDPFGDTRIEQPLNVNVCDSNGVTPLHLACLCGRLELVTLLLDSGANVNIQSRISKMTPLHMACQNHHFNVSKALLETGYCNVNIQDAHGNTAMHYACQTADLNLVELLLKYKPLLFLTNNEKKSPLDEARDALSLSIVHLLSKHLKTT